MRRRRRIFGKATGGMRRRRVAGEMNRTEARYASEVLDPLEDKGEIVKYWFEEWTWKLGPDLRYTPDFVVLYTDGRLEAHEVKARDNRTGKYRAEDDAKVKMKVFADTIPILLQVVWPKARGIPGWDSLVLSPLFLED